MPHGGEEFQERAAERARTKEIREQEVSAVREASAYPHIENADKLPQLSESLIAHYIHVAFNEYRERNRHLYKSGADVRIYEDDALDREAEKHSRHAADRNAGPSSLVDVSVIDTSTSCGATVYTMAIIHHLVREYDWIERYSRARATKWHKNEESSGGSVVGTTLETIEHASVRLGASYIGVGLAKSKDAILGTDAWYVTVLLSPCSKN